MNKLYDKIWKYYHEKTKRYRGKKNLTIPSNFTTIQTILLLKTSVQYSLIPIFFTQCCFNAYFRSIIVKRTSWKSLETSHTRQRPGSSWNWQRWRSARKKSRRSGVWIRACTMQFMKQVFPKFRRPRRPRKNSMY